MNLSALQVHSFTITRPLDFVIMVRARISYVCDDAGQAISKAHSRQKGKVLELDGIQASKHVRLRLSGSGVFDSHDFLLTHGTPEALPLPFGPPLEIGTHLHTDLALNWSTKLLPWLSSLGLEPHQPVVCDNFQAWAAPLDGPKPRWNAWIDSLVEPPFDLGSADAVSVRSDVNENSTVIEAWFAPKEWHESILPMGVTTEIGILERKPLPSGGFAYSGRYRNIGEGSATSQPLLFQEHPAENIVIPGSVDVSFAEPYGLHPVLKLQVLGDQPAPECRLFAKLDLTPSLFVDRYQLDNLVEVWGETDLEAANWSVNRGSVALVWLPGNAENYEIPLHFRYQIPTSELEVRQTLIAPNVFWACPSRDGREHLPNKLKIDSAFPPDTEFWVLQSNEVGFRIPAIDTEHFELAEHTTSVVVIFATMLLILAILRKTFILNASYTKKNKLE